MLIRLVIYSSNRLWICQTSVNRLVRYAASGNEQVHKLQLYGFYSLTSHRLDIDAHITTMISDKCTIYVLRCKSERYYVGRSNIPERRILQHFKEQGSAWTRLHPPIEIFKIYENCSRLDEDKYTKEYMEKFGIENVRGGSYCSVELSDDQYSALVRELRNAYDKCTRCGRSGHYVKDCYARTEVAWQQSSKRAVTNEPVSTNKRSKAASDAPCFRCGKTGHWARDCTAEESDESSDSKPENEACFRCGRLGHWASSCFAHTTIDGWSLD